MATKHEIWFDKGLKIGAKYMLIIYDTSDYEVYPVFVSTDRGCMEKYRSPGDMQSVMEIYDLSLDKISQLHEHRAFHLPS